MIKEFSTLLIFLFFFPYAFYVFTFIKPHKGVVRLYYKALGYQSQALARRSEALTYTECHELNACEHTHKNNNVLIDKTLLSALHNGLILKKP